MVIISIITPNRFSERINPSRYTGIIKYNTAHSQPAIVITQIAIALNCNYNFCVNCQIDWDIIAFQIFLLILNQSDKKFEKKQMANVLCEGQIVCGPTR